jgi:hypothetical protein
MKKILFILFVFFTINGLSQNLVPNPGFEQYSSCPYNVDQLSLCMPWSSYRETPDYLNTCSNTTLLITPPDSYNGFQFPHSGNAYAGFYVFASNSPNNRELIGSSLSSALIIEQKYFISFYVNLGGSLFSKSTIASNKMGVKFSTVPYSYSNPAPINNAAHFYSNSIIDDTVKWTRISGSFVADSAYSYIIIGNFFADSLTNTINLATINKYAYYFIDDVCVTTDSLYNENWLGVKEQNVNNNKKILIFPNPTSGKFTITSNSNEAITNIIISDVTGRVVYENSFGSNVYDTENDFSYLQPNTYFVKINTTNNIYNTKMVIVK